MKRTVLALGVVVLTANRALPEGMPAHGSVPIPVLRSLKPGSVRAEGFLLKQLELQRDGLTGHGGELSSFAGEPDWLTGERRGGAWSWEQGAYYFRGLLALAQTLGDPKLGSEAKRRVEALIASRTPDGNFACGKYNYWAKMPLVEALRDYYHETGDERVADLLRAYFGYVVRSLESRHLGDESCWACTRGADEIEVMLWFFDRTGECLYLDFARKLSEEVFDWAGFYDNRVKRPPFVVPGRKYDAYERHIVNCMQGLKNPAMMWRLLGDDGRRTAYAAFRDPDGWLMKSYGRVDGMINGSEPCSDRQTTAGTELCAQTERINSSRYLLETFGDACIADDMESVAYNTLPGTLTPDGRGMRYYHVLNLPKCDNGDYGYANIGKERWGLTPGPDSGFHCCNRNFHLAWPRFVQNLWMETQADEPTAVAYGPCRVRAQKAEIRERTHYPFDGRVMFEIVSAVNEPFALRVRVPAWTRGAKATVNGRPVETAFKPGTFASVRRMWHAGDRLELEFPMETKVSRGWNNGSVAIVRGPLVYALKLEAEWTVAREKDGKERDNHGFKTYEVRPKSAWNYALVFDGETIDAQLSRPKNFPDQPFDPETPPLSLSVPAVVCERDGWGGYRTDHASLANEPPKSPVAGLGGDLCRLTLIPLGSTQIRMTYFPWCKR